MEELNNLWHDILVSFYFKAKRCADLWKLMTINN